MKRYLVTGGTGFIGRALVRGLVSQGHQVRVFDNNSRGQISSLADIAGSFEFVEGDIRDSAAVSAACESIDVICHLAFVNGTDYFYSKPELVLEVGVKGMVNILDGAIKEKVSDFMLMSSSEVYQTPAVVPTDESVALSVPDPLNPRYSYGGGKIISELMALNYGRKFFERVTVVRPHNVYGPNMGWEHVIPQFALRMKELAAGSGKTVVQFPIQGSGKETRAFVYIDDFTQGLIHVLKKGKHLEIYHVGRSEELAIAEVAREVAKYFKVEVELVPSAPASGGTNRRCPDIKKILALGYRPDVGFSEGVQKTVRWYDENAHLKSKSH